MGNESTKEQFLQAVKEDKERDLIELLKKHREAIEPNVYVNHSKDFTALNIAASFGSIKASEILIKNGWSVDMPERRDLNTPLLLACKFGYFNLMKMLFKYKADVSYENRLKMNCLDIAIVSGHYPIAYYLYLKDIKIKPKQEYEVFIKVPSFNLGLFYTTLMNKTSPEEAPSFALRPQTGISRTNIETKANDNDDLYHTDRNCSSKLFVHQAPSKNGPDLTLSIQTIKISHKTS